MAGCTGTSGSGAAPDLAPQATATSSSGTSLAPVASQTGGISRQAEASVEAALNEAAGRLGVARASLTTEIVEEREWTDRSLGCPREGVLYAQVITPGYLVVVVGNGRRLEYHTDTTGTAVFCREL